MDVANLVALYKSVVVVIHYQEPTSVAPSNLCPIWSRRRLGRKKLRDEVNYRYVLLVLSARQVRSKVSSKDSVHSCNRAASMNSAFVNGFQKHGPALVLGRRGFVEL